jgi:hypothetical protein
MIVSRQFSTPLDPPRSHPPRTGGRAVDTVISVDSFAGRASSVPSEFREFEGLLLIKARCPVMNLS